MYSLKDLSNDVWSVKCAKTSMPTEYVPKPNYSDKTANGLTKAIIKFIQIQNGQAERISNTGRPIDNTKTFTDSLGFSRRIGSIEWIPGTGTNGTADISAIIKGRSIKIEVKIGSDRQSENQKKYQQTVEQAGGVYIIAKSWQDFYSKYLLL